jgi:solute carrier family 10 (sodium/bile acid cotransporter), member 7
LKQLKFNIFVQVYGFGVVSAAVFGISRILIVTNALIVPLANGLVTCACLPMAITMVIILAKTADGDEATAVFNSAFGNMLGVILSPLLILGYLGISGDVDLGDVFYKLVLRVVVPLVVGQIVQYFCPPIRDFAKTHSRALSKSQMFTLVFIIYTIFCSTFQKGNKVPAGSIVVVIAVQLGMLSLMMLLAWYLLKFLFPTEPRLRVTGLFCCTFKTVSLGVPLINSMYEGNVNLALYILPLLIWNPLQLLIGSFLSPILRRFVQSEMERLAAQGIAVAPDRNNDEDGGGNGDGSALPSDTNKMPDVEATHDEEAPKVDAADGDEKNM